MELYEYYEELYKRSIEKIKSGEYQIDPLIDSPHDKRAGLTILIRPPAEVKDKIHRFLEELKSIDSAQYYYPHSDIHITVMSVISCYEGFHLDRISIPAYETLIAESLKGIKNIKIKLHGITASDSCVMIRGYPQGSLLDTLRDNLRTNFINSDLEQSIDKRYAIKTAHSTVVRFQNRLNNTTEYLKILEKYKNMEFGEFLVKELEMVFNDWYQRERNTKRLQSFGLPLR